MKEISYMTLQRNSKGKQIEMENFLFWISFLKKFCEKEKKAESSFHLESKAIISNIQTKR